MYPESAEALGNVVDWTLHHRLGRRLERDQDGDFPVRTGAATIYVQVLDDDPAVRLFAPLVFGVRDGGRAVAAVLALNRTTTSFRFVLAGDLLYVDAVVPVHPFVPAQLLDQLSALAAYLDDAYDRRLADRLCGESAFVDDDDEDGDEADDDEDDEDEADDDDEVDDEDRDDEESQDWLAAADDDRANGGVSVGTALLILAQLSYNGDHGLSAPQVARLFGDDRVLLLHGIRDCEEQEISWRERAASARANGADKDAEVFDLESAAAATTATDLRGTLRHLVMEAGPNEGSGEETDE